MNNMTTSAMIEEKLRVLPSDCLEDLSAYIDFLLYRRSIESQRGDAQPVFGSYYGKLPSLPDGLTLQRESRDEWN